MSKLLEELGSYLLRPVGSSTWRSHVSDGAGVEGARAKAINRLGSTLQDLAEGMPGIPDAAVLLRQVIRANSRLTMHQTWWERLQPVSDNVGLWALTGDDADVVQVLADPWKPDWLAEAQTIDDVALRRRDEPALGSGLLQAMTGFTGYRSTAQKAAVETCLFAAPGTTTLVTLPTGSGKSLCALLPAWQASRGGQVRGGTTLVIVPTVALALDQQRNAARFFADALDETHRPQARAGSSTDEYRETVRDAIRDGKLPILFTSPEALLRSDLYGVCLEAARNGWLKRLVIDEAHLVETWGAGFRTEFQLLAAYRKRLLAESDGHLITILLSATISERCASLLERLFSEEGAFGTIQANRLRPEPSFWFASAPDWRVQRTRVLEALYHLPRPAILYVTRPAYAESWLRELRHQGFSRVAAFTGNTLDADREQLLRDWGDDRLDLMVATSAFGVGVDKADVRTVVHACLPENLDRFYQEVGRGGRDGCSAISLLCYTSDDRGLAYSLSLGKVITPEKAFARWEAMRLGAQFSGSRATVNIDAVPAHITETYGDGERNRDWNEHVLLLLQRAGLLSLDDTRNDVSAAAVAPADGYSGGVTPVSVILHHVDQDWDRDTLLPRIEECRKREVQEAKQSVDALAALVQTYAGAVRGCIAHTLSRLYPDTTLACGGCAGCRRTGRAPYVGPLSITCTLAALRPAADYLSGDLRRYMVGGSALNIVWDRTPGDTGLRYLRDLVVRLVGAGLQQVVLPRALSGDEDWMRLFISDLAADCAVPHVLLSEREVLDVEYPLLPVPTLCIYPFADDGADALYRQLRGAPPFTGSGAPLVHLVSPALRLPSLGGLFLDKVNGLQVPAQDVSDLLAGVQDEDFF